jgi:Tfp pilus assembly protein PilF
MDLRKMPAAEFARRLNAAREQSDRRFAFFLGAGCSVSSGIPAAATLVKDYWLPRLCDLNAVAADGHDSWIRSEFPGYNTSEAAVLYGPIMERLFLFPDDRQLEIERLCDGLFPGFGYAVMAGLVALDGGHFNVVLTTNFDDLIADALYLFTRARPLVIHHESLAGFIRPTRTRPLVVKLHGDHRLAPQNTASETEALKGAIEQSVRGLLRDRTLIFVGYGGADKGVVHLLESLPDDQPLPGVYWVNRREPNGIIRLWLNKRNAIWVGTEGFDELMLLVHDAFDLSHPDQRPLDAVFQRYFDTYEALSGRVRASTDPGPEAKALREAAERTDETFTNWWAVELKTRAHERTDPEEADRVYKQGIRAFPNSAELLGSYAIFLTDVRSDHDQAEIFFKRAIEADPRNTITLGNYANFLTTVRSDHDQAETFFKRAIEADPRNTITLGNYANFLTTVRSDHDQAETFFKLAIEADPRHANILGNYANFLMTVRSDLDQAETFYKRAIEADPRDANILGNYAFFSQTVRSDHDQAETFFKRAIEADPRHANTVGNYANFLQNVRSDHDQAETYYKRAIEADPRHANNLGNYAGFQLLFGGEHRREEALEILQQVLSEPDLPDALAAECWFYAAVYRPKSDREEAVRKLKQVLQAGARSPGWDLEPHVARARKMGHPDADWLEKVAAVISFGAEIAILADWPEWRAAD